MALTNARGSYGAIWRATLQGEVVAVKVPAEIDLDESLRPIPTRLSPELQKSLHDEQAREWQLLQDVPPPPPRVGFAWCVPP